MQRKQAGDSAVDGDVVNESGSETDDAVRLGAWVPRHDSKPPRLLAGLFGTARRLGKGP